MRFVVHAYEAMYNGAHGYEDWFIYESETITDAIEAGYEASCEIVETYSETASILEDEVEELMMNDETLTRAKAYEITLDNMALYDLWKIKENCCFDSDMINSLLVSNPQRFVKEWCE